MQDLLRIFQRSGASPEWAHRRAPPARYQLAGHRHCTGCDQTKPDGEFYPMSRLNKDGTRSRRSRCKQCEKDAIKERRRG